MAPVVFKVYMVAPCISKLNLKGLHAVSVAFEVYTVVPFDSMRLHASLNFILMVSMAPVVFEIYKVTPCGSMHLYILFKRSVYAAVVFEVYMVAPWGSMQLHVAPFISRLNLKSLHTAPVVFKVYTVTI